MVKVGNKELRTAPARGKVGSGPRPATLADASGSAGSGGQRGSALKTKYKNSAKSARARAFLEKQAAAGAKKSGASRRKGPRSNKPKRCKGGEPVDIFTGEVLQSQEDLFLVGDVRLVFRREYSSAWCLEKLPFGRGWSHNFHQTITLGDGTYLFRDEDGRTVDLGLIEDGEAKIYRGLRLEIRRKEQRFEVKSLEDGRIRIFEPLNKGQSAAVLRKIKEPSRRVTRLEYADGRLVKITAPQETAFGLQYDEEGRIVRLSELNKSGHELSFCTYEYHWTSELSRVVDATGTELRFEYEAFHRLSSATLPTGAIFRWFYDDEGRCTETWGTGRLHHWRFDRRKGGREVVVTGIEQLRYYQFGGQGQLLVESEHNEKPIREFEYDDDLLVLSEKDGVGQITRFEYDDLGTLTARTDPAGNTTRIQHFANRVVETAPDGKTVEGHYDPRGYLICTRWSDGDELHYDLDKLGRIEAIFSKEGLLEERKLDDRDQVIWKKDAAGLITEFRYDERGYPVEKRDSLGRTWAYLHDAYGRLLKETGPDGTRTTKEYDAYGNITKETDARGRVTERKFLGTGELAEVKLPSGQRWKYSRNTNEELTKVTNPQGEETGYDVNVMGQRVAEVTFDGRRYRHEFDRKGLHFHVERPDKTFRDWEYDSLDRIVAESSSHGGRHYLRDAVGRVERAVTDEGVEEFVVEYQRDPLGRIVKEKQGDHELCFEYDQRSRVVARVVAGERTEYQYDRLGKLTAVTHQGKRTEIQRDAAGREINRLTKDQRVTIESHWDARDRLRQRRIVALELSADAEPGVVRGNPLLDGPLIPGQLVEKRVVGDRSFHWNTVGLLTEIEDQTWGRTSYEYNTADFLTSVTRGRSAEYFVFDANGSTAAALRTFDGAELKSVAEVDPSSVPLHPGAAVRRQAQDPGLAIHNLPAVPPLIGEGWTALMAEGAATRLQTTRGNVLTEHAHQRFDNDAAGRRTKRKHKTTGQTTRYLWDCRDQLREVRLPSGWKVRLFYDAFGRRVRKDVEPPEKKGAALRLALEKELLRRAAALERGEEPSPPPPTGEPAGYSVTYLWDDDELCAEIWSDGKQRVHVHERGTFVPLLQSEGGQVFQVVTDHLGTPKDLVDEAGRVVWSVAHGAWGNIVEGLLTEDCAQSPFRLLGQLYDPETGLCWTRFRVFETSTARWLSPDPLGLEGGENAFAFDGAPTVVVDPLGLSCEKGKTRRWAVNRRRLPEEETRPSKVCDDDEEKEPTTVRLPKVHVPSASPELQPYMGAINILGNDDGFKAMAMNDLNTIASTKTGSAVLGHIAASGKSVDIASPHYDPASSARFNKSHDHCYPLSADAYPTTRPDPSSPWVQKGPGGDEHVGDFQRGRGSDSQITYSPGSWPNTDSPGSPSDVILMHELVHSRSNAYGANMDRYRDPDPNWQNAWHNREEYNTVRTENDYRRERSLPHRDKYGQVMP